MATPTIEQQTGLRTPDTKIEINESYAIERIEEAGKEAFMMHYIDKEHPEKSMRLGVMWEDHRVYGFWVGETGNDTNMLFWNPDRYHEKPVSWHAGGEWLIVDDANNRVETVNGEFGFTNPDGIDQILPESFLAIPGQDHRLSHGGAWKKDAWKRFGVTYRFDENGLSITTKRLITTDLPENDPNYVSSVLLQHPRIETRTTTLSPTGKTETLEITALEDLIEGGGSHPYYAQFKKDDGSGRTIIVMPSYLIWKTRDDLVTTAEFEEIPDNSPLNLREGKTAIELVDHNVDTGFVLEEGQHPQIIHPSLGITLELSGEQGNLETEDMEDLSTGLIYIPPEKDPTHACVEVTDPTNRRTLNYIAKRDDNEMLAQRTKGLEIKKGETRGFRWKTIVHFHEDQQAA